MATESHSTHQKYQSNPFLVSITGLLEILKTNPVSALLLAFGLVVLYVLIALVGAIFIAILPLLGALYYVVAIAIFVALALGSVSMLGVSSMHGKNQSVSELLKDAQPKILPILGAGILISLAVGIGLVFFVIPGIIFAAWFALTYIVMFDENLGAIDSMKRSKKLVEGHVVEMIGAIFAGMMLSSGLLSTAAGVSPLIGRYQQIKALKASGVAKPKTHWLNWGAPLLIILFFIAYVGVIAASASHHTSNDYKNTNDFYINNNY